MYFVDTYLTHLILIAYNPHLPTLIYVHINVAHTATTVGQLLKISMGRETIQVMARVHHKQS